MALKQTISLPNETSGNHIRVMWYYIDHLARECSAHFYLYANERTPKSKPIVLIGKMRLFGDKFDKYLGAEALGKMENPSPDPCRSAIYCAAKAGEVISAGGELTKVDFTEAEDV